MKPLSPEAVVASSLPKDLRSRRKERTRRAFREAALTLFAEQGYDATTVAQIAELAELAERTFFLHFPTKEDVLFDVPAHDLRALGTHIEQAPADVADLTAIEDALVAVLAARADATDHKMTQLLVKAASSSSLIRGKQFDYHGDLVAEATRALSRRRDEETASPATASLAEVALRLFYLIILEWTTVQPDDLENLIRQRFATIRSAFRDPSRV